MLVQMKIIFSSFLFLFFLSSNHSSCYCAKLTHINFFIKKNERKKVNGPKLYEPKDLKTKKKKKNIFKMREFNQIKL